MNHLENRTVELEKLQWQRRLRVMPDFLGYPLSAFATVIALVLVVMLMEGASIALVYPILEIMQSGDDLATLAARSQMFRYTIIGFEKLGLPISLDAMLAVTVFFVILRQIFSYTMVVVRSYFAQSSIEKISSRTFELFAMAGIPYTERLRSGTLVNALFTESKRAAMFAQALQNVVSSILKTVVYVSILVLVSWKATILGLVVLIILSLTVSRSSIRGSKISGRLINRANDRLTRYVTERFGLFRLMKIQGTEHIETGLYKDEVRTLRDLNIDIARYGARIRTLIEGIAVIGGLALIYLATAIISLPLPVLGIFLIVLFRLMPVAQELSVSRQLLAANLQSLYYIDRISLEALAALEPDNGTLPFPGLKQEIKFENVSFAYPVGDGEGDSVPVLHNINLVIPAGKTTALLGASGAGKSTLNDLIPRLRDPTEGCIYFDDIPAKEIRLADLRNSMAMVSQDAMIIDGSIIENLRYGQHDASEEAVLVAARAAYADEFISVMSKGYETVVGERGVLLSGGQKQRIALARALLAKVPLLLLDEPTSALDAESEHAVQCALDKLMNDNEVTIIIIAHRLSTVRDADQIIVLEHGRLLGSGTHEDLMKSAPWYKRVVQLQLGIDDEKTLQRARKASSKKKTRKKRVT